MVISHRFLTAAAALGLTLGAASAANAADRVYLRTTTASTPLSSNGSEVELLAVQVPRGTWVVTAKTNPVNFGSGDYIRCRILVGAVQQDGGTTFLGNGGPGPSGELGPSVATIALQTAVRTTSPQRFSLRCWHDFPVAGEYVDPGASLLIRETTGPLN